MKPSDVDKLIEVLEKVHYDGAHGSPATFLHGIKGIWRNVTPFGRVFLALKSDGSVGNVVAGPDHIKGKSLEQAEAIGQAQLDKEKGGKVSSKDKVALADATQAAGDNKSAKDQIVRHLKENTPAKNAKNAKNNVHRLPTRNNNAGKQNERLQPNDKKTAAPAASSNKDKTNSESKGGATTSNEAGGLQGALDILRRPDRKTEEAIQKAHGALLDAAKNTKDDVLKLRLEKLAHGLDAGSISLTNARSQLKELVDNRNHGTPIKTPKPTKTEVDTLHDRAKIQNFIDGHKKEIASLLESSKKDIKVQSERAKDEAMLQLLQGIQSQVRTPAVKIQIKQLQSDAKKNNIGHRSVILRLLQILRRLLSLRIV